MMPVPPWDNGAAAVDLRQQLLPVHKGLTGEVLGLVSGGAALRVDLLLDDALLDQAVHRPEEPVKWKFLGTQSNQDH